MDGSTTDDQFVRFTRYTHNHAGGRTDFIEYIAASNGKADIRSWVKEYLSEEKEELYLRALRNLLPSQRHSELNPHDISAEL